MKILYYSPHPHLALNSQTGYGTHMREMIHAFEMAGHEVVRLIMGGEGNTSSRAVLRRSELGVKSSIKRLIPGILWETIKDYSLLRLDEKFESQVDAEIERSRPDMIYERGNYFQCSGISAAKAKGIPHILEMNAPQVVERRVRLKDRTLLERKARAIERKQLLGTTKVAVVSQALSDHFVREYNIPADRIICTPNAIDYPKVKSDESRVCAIKKKLGLNGSYVLGFVGSVLKWHRVDLLIEACEQLRKASLNVVVLIVGESRLIAELQRLSHRLGIGDAVIFAGRVPHQEVFNYIEAMDITVLPDNLWYQSPVKVFEYGAMAKPIIAPDNVTVRNLIKHREEGMLVRPSVQSLVEAIQYLLKYPTEASEMARMFQEKVFREYTWSRNVERVLNAVFEPQEQLYNPV